MGKKICSRKKSPTRKVLRTNKANKEFEGKMAEINNRNSLAQQKLQLERDKIKLARDNQANDLAVAKENAKGRKKS